MAPAWLSWERARTRATQRGWSWPVHGVQGGDVEPEDRSDARMQRRRRCHDSRAHVRWRGRGCRMAPRRHGQPGESPAESGVVVAAGARCHGGTRPPTWAWDGAAAAQATRGVRRRTRGVEVADSNNASPPRWWQPAPPPPRPPAFRGPPPLATPHLPLRLRVAPELQSARRRRVPKLHGRAAP